MDEMTAVRELRTDAPAADAGRLAAGRWKLMDAALAGDAPAGRWRRAADLGRTVAGTRPRRTALVALTAAGVTAGVLMAAGGAGPGGAGGSVNVSARSVAAVMDAVAAHEEAKGGGSFRADQFLYSKTTFCPWAGPCSYRPVSFWIQGDGSRSMTAGTPYQGESPDKMPLWSAGYSNTGGLSVHPVESYRLLDRLPSDPHALLQRINHDPGYFVHGPTSGALPWPSDFGGAPVTSQTPEAQFQRVANLLSLPETPARVKAALYRALALVPGVRLDAEPAKDAAGRSGIGVVFEGKPRAKGYWVERYELVFDSTSHAYLGSRESFGVGSYGRTIAASNAVLATGVVDHAGQVPGGPVPPPSSIEMRPPLAAPKVVTPPAR